MLSIMKILNQLNYQIKVILIMKKIILVLKNWVNSISKMKETKITFNLKPKKI